MPCPFCLHPNRTADVHAIRQREVAKYAPHPCAGQMAEGSINNYAHGAQTARQLGLVDHCELCVPLEAPPSPYEVPLVAPPRPSAGKTLRQKAREKFGDLRKTATDVARDLEDLNFAVQQKVKLNRACRRDEIRELRKCLGDHKMQDYVVDAAVSAAMDKVMKKSSIKNLSINAAEKCIKVTIEGTLSPECAEAVGAWNNSLCEKKILPGGVIRINTVPKIVVDRAESDEPVASPGGPA